MQILLNLLCKLGEQSKKVKRAKTMDHLNKQQIVLLMMFVSFVTAIATAVFTVSLLGQSNINAVQTVTQVVERTIEKVAPTQDKGNNSSLGQQNSDLSVEKIASLGSGSLALIYNGSATKVIRQKEENKATPTYKDYDSNRYTGSGIILDNGFVLTTQDVASGNGDFSVVLADGNVYEARVMSLPTNAPSLHGVSVLKLSVPEFKTEAYEKFKSYKSFKEYIKVYGKKTVSPVSLSSGSVNSNSVYKLGKTVVMISSIPRPNAQGAVLSNDISIHSGIIEKLYNETSGAISGIRVGGIQDSSIISGNVLFSLSGDVIGLKISNDPKEDPSAFVPSSVIHSEVAQIVTFDTPLSAFSPINTLSSPFISPANNTSSLMPSSSVAPSSAVPSPAVPASLKSASTTNK